MNALKRVFIVSTCLLTACAPPRPAVEAPINEVMPVEKRETQTSTVKAWEISGAMAAKNQKKSFTASLNWKQTGANNYQMRLFGPLGGGTVIIEKKGSTVTYRDGPKTIKSNSADQLLYKQTGIRLPVDNLYYWVRGLPAPGGIQKKKYDRYNHLKVLKQAGYTIDYMRYTSKGKVDLPSKIRLHGRGVTIKLVIKKWEV